MLYLHISLFFIVHHSVEIDTQPSSTLPIPLYVNSQVCPIIIVWL
jgi:hypothetical protein